MSRSRGDGPRRDRTKVIRRGTDHGADIFAGAARTLKRVTRRRTRRDARHAIAFSLWATHESREDHTDPEVTDFLAGHP